MNATPTDLFLVKGIDILHPDWSEGLDWRRCTLTLTPTLGRDPDITLSVHVRGKSAGASVHHLFECAAFSACLERVFRDILEAGNPALAGALRDTPITQTSGRSYLSVGMGGNLAYILGREFHAACATLSAHDRRALARAGRHVAAREHARRHG